MTLNHDRQTKHIAIYLLAIIGLGLFSYHQYTLRIHAEEELELQKQLESNKSWSSPIPVSENTLLQKYDDSQDNRDFNDNKDFDTDDNGNEDEDDFLNLNTNDTDTTLDIPTYSTDIPQVEITDSPQVIDFSNSNTSPVYPNPANDEYVQGYMRSNGTYVNGYHRQHANETEQDNYSYDGNYNPWTGGTGHRR